MRRELRFFDEEGEDLSPLDLGAWWVYSALRSAQWAALRSLTPRLTLGSRSWHVVQHHLSQLSSLEPDWRMRSWFIENTMLECGPSLCVFPNSVFYYPRNVRIGEDVFINRGVFVVAPARVSIGDAVLIGPNVVINSGNHRFGDPRKRIRDQGHDLKPIEVGNDVWIGANSCILAGAIVEDGAVIAAGSVVRGRISAGSVVGGAPAREIAPPRDRSPE